MEDAVSHSGQLSHFTPAAAVLEELPQEDLVNFFLKGQAGRFAGCIRNYGEVLIMFGFTCLTGPVKCHRGHCICLSHLPLIIQLTLQKIYRK